MSDQLSNDLASLRIQREENPELKSTRRTWWVGGGLAVLVAIALFFGSSAFGARVFKTDVQLTEIRLVSPAQASIQVTSTGYVVAQTHSMVGAKLPGRVAEVLVAEGAAVSAGDVLVRLEDAEQRAAIASARARALASRARQQSAEANLAETRRQFERERDLAANGASARSVAEDLEARVRGLEESARAAKADWEAAVAEQNALELNLTYMVVTAPITGIVTAKPVAVGELVGPTATGPVAEITDFSSLVIETDVPEARLSLIRKGGPTEIVLDAYPTTRHRGQVVEISPKVNRTKATVVVKVKFADPVTGVLPDMSARVSFLESELDAAAMKEPPKVFVPGSAVVERGGQKVVFVMEQDKARQVAITLGPPMGAGFELTTGPDAGTQVIANPPTQIADGYPVREAKE